MVLVGFTGTVLVADAPMEPFGDVLRSALTMLLLPAVN